MKKLLLISLLLVASLFVAGPAFAGEIDGIWALLLPDGTLESVLMIRENGGTIIAATLDLDMDNWEALAGPFDGTTAQLTGVLTRWDILGVAVTFSSATSATGTITSCTPTATAQCQDVPVGTTFTLAKLF